MSTGDAGGVAGSLGSACAIATGVSLWASMQAQQNPAMPTCNAVDRLAVDKRLSYQRSLLVLAPVPPRLTQDNLHTASACDQSNDPSLD